MAKEEEAKNLLQGTALLEFRILKDPEFAISLMQKIDDVLAGKNLEDTTKIDAAETAKTETKRYISNCCRYEQGKTTIGRRIQKGTSFLCNCNVGSSRVSLPMLMFVRARKIY